MVVVEQFPLSAIFITAVALMLIVSAYKSRRSKAAGANRVCGWCGDAPPPHASYCGHCGKKLN